jgi:hypothetical protein
MVTPSKDISTETMSQIARSKDNKYELLYFPFHGVVTALRAMFAISDANYTFTHPIVSVIFFAFSPFVYTHAEVSSPSHSIACIITSFPLHH